MCFASHISANEKSYLQKANEALESNLQEFRSTTSSKNLSALSQRCRELEQRNSSLSVENRSLRQSLSKAEAEADKVLERVNRVLDKLPDTVAEAFVSAWKQDKQKTQHRSQGRER